MRHSYWLAAFVAVLFSFQTFANAQALCGKAKALDFTTDCTKRSSIIDPITESWTFTIAAGSKFGAVVSVRFTGKFRAKVQVKNAAGTVLEAASNPGTSGEHAFVGVKEAGAYTLEVTPYYANTPVIYLARVQAAADVPLSAPHQKQIAAIAKSCCDGVKSATCDLLAAPAGLCGVAPNACDAKGNLVWLSLVGGLSCPKGITTDGELQGLTTLNTFDLSYNNIVQDAMSFTPVVLQLDPLENLEYIYVAHNKLSGVFMDETNPVDGKFKVLDFTNNSLSGRAPAVLFQQAQIEEIYFAHNNLSDAWQSIDENADSLAVVDLSHNSLSGTGAVFSGPVIYVDLSFNKFMMNFYAPNNTDAIVYYAASHNDFESTVPPSLHDAPRLAYVDVSNNKVSAQLDFMLSPPTDPIKCTKLSVLKVNDNMMYGSIFFSIANFTNLRTLELQNNRFGGNLLNMANGLTPTNLVTQFNISGNDFVGPVPAGFKNLAMLSPKALPSTFIATDDAGVAEVLTPRGFDITGNSNITGEFPVFIPKAEAAIRKLYAASKLNTIVDFKVSDSSSTFTCPTANGETLEASDVYSFQTDGYTCYTPDNREIGLEDALSSLVPNIPSPPPPPKDLYPPGPPAKADEKLKIIGICLGVGLALALAACGIFAYKWRDLDLKLKSRYHKQGEDFKPSYVVSPRADAKNGEDQENGNGKRVNGFDGVV